MTPAKAAHLETGWGGGRGEAVETQREEVGCAWASQVCFPEPGKITVEGRILWGRSFQRPSGEVSQGQPGPEAEGQLQTPGQLQWRVSGNQGCPPWAEPCA